MASSNNFYRKILVAFSLLTVTSGVSWGCGMTVASNPCSLSLGASGGSGYPSLGVIAYVPTSLLTGGVSTGGGSGISYPPVPFYTNSSKTPPYAFGYPSLVTSPGYGMGSYPSYGMGSYPGYGMGSYPSYGMGSYPGYGMGSYPSYGMGSYPGYGMGSYPGYGMGSYPSYGMGSYPSYGMGSYPSYGMGSYPSYGMGSYPSYGMGLYPSYGMGTSSGCGSGVYPGYGSSFSTCGAGAFPTYGTTYPVVTTSTLPILVANPTHGGSCGTSPVLNGGVVSPSITDGTPRIVCVQCGLARNLLRPVSRARAVGSNRFY